MSRPEDTSLTADAYYDAKTASQYTTSSRIQSIQATMTLRALDLLALPGPSLILDVGCGSGLSGAILSSPTAHPSGPHAWVGLDVSPAMLEVALRGDAEGDLLLADAGQGVPFRAGSFDAAVSISAVQWLCSAESSDEGSRPEAKLARFFGGLYASLKRGGRAVCQFYPRDERQRDMICRAAVKAGFGAGLMVDDPGTKNEKTYLVLTVGGVVSRGKDGEADVVGGDITRVVEGMDGVEVVETRRGRVEGSGAGARVELKKGSKAWISKKKEQMERKGKIVKASSKYTGRKRRPAF